MPTKLGITTVAALQSAVTVGTVGPLRLQFGNELLLIADDADWTAMRRMQSADAIRELPSTNIDELYLVVQKGRLFQKEHPEVHLLYDRGRYLVVRLDRERAQQLRQPHEPCYALRPIAEQPIIFDVRDRERFRMARNANIQSLVDGIAREDYEADLLHLAQMPTRHSLSSHFSLACSWAVELFESFGFAAERRNITVSGNTSYNVIAERLGTGSGGRRVILVLGHLDSVNNELGPSAPAPGADDNASGSAGVLQVARSLCNESHWHDLRFILTGGEEQGLIGSTQYLATLSSTERARIRAVINMDMIGCRNTSGPTVLIEGATVSQLLIDDLSAAAATYTQLSVETSFNPFASDHVSFIQAGIPAVLTIEGADSANINIHTANDTADYIDYDLALEILRMNVAYVATAMQS